MLLVRRPGRRGRTAPAALDDATRTGRADGHRHRRSRRRQDPVGSEFVRTQPGCVWSSPVQRRADRLTGADRRAAAGPRPRNRCSRRGSGAGPHDPRPQGPDDGVPGSVEETFWALRRFVEVLARDGPLIIVSTTSNGPTPCSSTSSNTWRSGFRGAGACLALARPDFARCGPTSWL